MCTLILAHRRWDSCPLFLASNRDERIKRASRPPERWASAINAPVDEEAGGTWLGYNDQGVVAALTNRYGALSDLSKRSRGELVPLVLEAKTAALGAEAIASIDLGVYNPFHLLIADTKSAWLVRPLPEGTHLERLSAGYHVFTERSFQSPPSARESSIYEALETWPSKEAPQLSHVQKVLAQHATPAFDGHCVHLPELDYGTRSSSVLSIDAKGLVSWFFADGAPCEHTLTRINSLG